MHQTMASIERREQGKLILSVTVCQISLISILFCFVLSSFAESLIHVNMEICSVETIRVVLVSSTKTLQNKQRNVLLLSHIRSHLMPTQASPLLDPFSGTHQQSSEHRSHQQTTITTSHTQHLQQRGFLITSSSHVSGTKERLMTNDLVNQTSGAACVCVRSAGGVSRGQHSGTRLDWSQRVRHYSID